MAKKKLPKYIEKKCQRLSRLCTEANMLRIEVERWCEENDVDVWSDEWQERVKDEVCGCSYILDVTEIEALLNTGE